MTSPLCHLSSQNTRRAQSIVIRIAFAAACQRGDTYAIDDLFELGSKYCCIGAQTPHCTTMKGSHLHWDVLNHPRMSYNRAMLSAGALDERPVYARASFPFVPHLRGEKPPSRSCAIPPTSIFVMKTTRVLLLKPICPLKNHGTRMPTRLEAQ